MDDETAREIITGFLDRYDGLSRRAADRLIMELHKAGLRIGPAEVAAENARLRAVVEDIVAHANPIAEDDDGFVSVGYTVTVGAIHRAIAALQGATDG